MKVAILGDDGPLARAAATALERRGHTVGVSDGECAICFPGSADLLRQAIANGKFGRLVLRSHAAAYGANPKNPGMMDENRVSLLPASAPERRWLEFEDIAAGHPNRAIIRFTNILAPEEGDPIVHKLMRRAAFAPAGRDPNVQFLSLEDAAELLAAACEGSATGVFNAAGAGAVPLKKALAAAGATRVPIPGAIARGRLDQLQYTSTVSSERARRELDWQPARSTAEALADFLATKPGARPDVLREPFDDWGLDPAYIRVWGAWFWFLRNVYWRIEHEGMENIPAAGRALFVANHRGLMPLDAVMHLSLILKHRRRIPRFLIIHSLLRPPFLCNFLTKLGGVIASQENAARLFGGENLVGIFPEGIRGAFTPYRRAYQLRDFSKSGFARIAIENQAPVIPAAVVGHAEIFPILGRIDWSYLTREWGWPYLPIAPMLPLAPVPLPSKWHVRVLEPVPLQGLRPADGENARLVKEFSRHIQHLLQQNIDDMVARRKHIFWGKLRSDAPPASESRPQPSTRTARASR
jgi:1-acyl-sn-glycerol-3-phosphate acyltransferase